MAVSAHTPVRQRMGRRARTRLYKAVALVLLLPGLVWVLTPTVWMFSAAFSSLEQIMKFPPELWPDPWVFSNFYEGFAFLPFGRYFLNSTQIAGLRVLGQVAGCFSGWICLRTHAGPWQERFVHAGSVDFNAALHRNHDSPVHHFPASRMDRYPLTSHCYSF